MAGSQIMEQPKPLKILEVCKVTPSPCAMAALSLPLTFFDLMFFRSPPTERILFYSLTTKDPPLESIVQDLKHSLSLTLSYFLPLAGNLTWPQDSLQPIIFYKSGDGVSLTIAESDAKFNRLSANHIKKATESHSLVPKLEAIENVAPAMAIQITFFPNSGFSIGIITNHVVTDGKTTTMFLKSWASICKLNLLTLSPELTPFLDRTALKDPVGIDKLYLKYFPSFVTYDSNPNIKRFRLPSKVAISEDVVSGTFELTRADIEKLRKKVATSQTHHLTTFVLTFAYVSTCMIKAQGIQGKIALSFLVDWRPRWKCSIPTNYFGNCLTGHFVFVEKSEFKEENALAIISNKLSGAIMELKEKNSVVEIVEDLFSKWREEMPINKIIVVAGSPRFGVYEIDFGWGSCEKVEMTSLAPGDTFSITDSGKGNGGVEIGIALPNDVMNVFASLFYNEAS